MMSDKQNNQKYNQKSRKHNKSNSSSKSTDSVSSVQKRSTTLQVRSKVVFDLEGRDIFGDPAPQPDLLHKAINQIEIDRKSLDSVNLRDALRKDQLNLRVEEIDRVDLKSRMNSSIYLLTERKLKNEIVDFVLGLDIGSTSTKCIIRLPYKGSGAAQPVPAPKFLQADDHPYYWRTIFWKTNDGRFSLLPEQDSIELSTLKVDFIAAGSSADFRNTAELQMTAYAALMMRQSLGWYVATYPNGAANSNFFISINVGFPSASMEDQGDQERFRTCCRAAGNLALSGQDVTESSVSAHLANVLVSKMEPEDDQLVEVYPELSGAISGFIYSSASRTGVYVLVDIGGLTLDCIFFSLRKDGNDPHYAVYAADICRHGSQVIGYWLKQGNAQSRAVAVLGSFYAKTVVAAHKKLGQRIPTPGAKNLAQLPTLLIGGGRRSEEHRRAPDWANANIKNSTSAVTLRVEDLEPPLADMDVPKLGKHGVDRLLVAAGLSLPRTSIPTWIHSRNVPDAEPIGKWDYTNAFVGPEQT